MNSTAAKYMSILLVIAIAMILGITVASLCEKYLTVKIPKTQQAQKYRFGEMCPDGLRVEYISTVRLPKSVVCQKEIGSE